MTDHNLLVVSDFHLGEGYDPETGRYCRLEDFFFSSAFARFLRYHEAIREEARLGGRAWRLVINGDLFDFMQIVSLPEEGEPLRAVKGVEAHRSLRRSEWRHGLGTSAAESEWKLRRIARGHQRFFATLGWFVAQGNSLAIIKGNHDVDLHWPQVQARLVEEVGWAYERLRQERGEGEPAWSDDLAARIQFFPWFYHEPGRVYVEHGGQYEALNAFADYMNPVLPNDPQRIELPLGSLMVRYLFNKIEDVHPFADNIKPITRYLGWAFSTDMVGSLDLLVTRGWVFVQAVWRAGCKFLASARSARQRKLTEMVPGSLPLPAEVAEEIARVAKRQVDRCWQQWVGSGVKELLFFLIGLIAIVCVILAGMTVAAGERMLAVVYLVFGGIAFFVRRGVRRTFGQILAGDYLVEVAYQLEEVLAPDHAVGCIVMGHSHNAGLEKLQDAWYVNTGAWVPVYSHEGPIDGREELTFLRLSGEAEGAPELLHWDDAAGEPTRVVLWSDPRP